VPPTVIEVSGEVSVTPAAPPAAAVVWVVPSGNLKPPVALWMVPLTESGYAGVVVPMPTLPVLSMRMRSVREVVPLVVVAKVIAVPLAVAVQFSVERNVTFTLLPGKAAPLYPAEANCPRLSPPCVASGVVAVPRPV
jgi:hypothetical protein